MSCASGCPPLASAPTPTGMPIAAATRQSAPPQMESCYSELAACTHEAASHECSWLQKRAVLLQRARGAHRRAAAAVVRGHPAAQQRTACDRVYTCALSVCLRALNVLGLRQLSYGSANVLLLLAGAALLFRTIWFCEPERPNAPPARAGSSLRYLAWPGAAHEIGTAGIRAGMTGCARPTNSLRDLRTSSEVATVTKSP